MVVRSVKIDKKVPQGTEQGKGAGRAVDELFAGGFSGQDSLEKKASFLARIRAVTGEEGGYAGIGGILKDGLDRARVRTRANRIPIRPIAEDQRQRAKNDGFSCAGLPGDGDESRPGLPEELLNKGKVANAQRGERCGHERTMP